MTEVKICGLTNSEDAKTALSLGADYLGFVIEADSPRSISSEFARKIISELSSCKTVAVTVSESVSEIQKLVSISGVCFVQISVPLSQDKFVQLKQALPEKEFIQTVHVCEPELDSINPAKQGIDFVEENADFVLLDSRAGAGLGGTGRTHDWNKSAEIVRGSSKKFFLAGGLNPENVSEAIQKVKPYAVDVSTGVSFDGVKKDFEKMKKFIEVAKNG